ncbi:hypothetical protein SFRURICE_014079 [Spodoptera frugiperda]|nr:hypothetical protein SFRURICE_014079 [Spodoptera frugiperda]
MANREVDTSRVIDEVRLRKKLWDASDPLYKNKDARNKAWEDIADTLFENISGEEKQQLAPTVENEVDESLNETIPSPFLPSPLANIDNTLDSMVSSEHSQDSDIFTQQVFSNTQQGEQNDRGVDSPSSQKPWLEKRKRRASFILFLKHHKSTSYGGWMCGAAIQRVLENRPIAPAAQGSGRPADVQTEERILEVIRRNPCLGTRSAAKLLRRRNGSVVSHWLVHSVTA